MIAGSLILLTLSILFTILVLLAIAAPIFIHLPQFGRAPSGKRLERIEKSPNYRNGKFHNISETEVMDVSARQIIKSFRRLIFKKKKALRPAQPLEMEHRDLKHLPQDKDLYVWFGHSSYLLSLHGTTVLVDPVFCNASPFSFINKAFAGTERYTPEDMPDRIDYLVITHDHYDHLDYQTVVRLRERVQHVVCPLGVGEHFERWGFSTDILTELDWYEHATPGDKFTFRCLPARHFSGRALKRNNTLWGAFLIETGSGNIFVGGDGGYGPHFKQVGKQFSIRLAILENGQYNQQWRNIHTMPGQLGMEAAELGAEQVITVHHSKYMLSTHPWDEPLRNEAKARHDYGINLLVAKLGEITPIDDTPEDIA